MSNLIFGVICICIGLCGLLMGVFTLLTATLEHREDKMTVIQQGQCIPYLWMDNELDVNGAGNGTRLDCVKTYKCQQSK